MIGCMGKPTDSHPTLPFAEGLPEVEPPGGRRRRRHRPTGMLNLPIVGRWVRARRWLKRYVGDVWYGLLVKGGVGLLFVLAGLIGERWFDPFGRQVAMPEPPSPWIVEVTREKR